MASDRETVEIWGNTGNAIIKKLNDVRRQTAVTEAIELLLGRMVGAGNSLSILHEHSQRASAPLPPAKRGCSSAFAADANQRGNQIDALVVCRTHGLCCGAFKLRYNPSGTR